MKIIMIVIDDQALTHVQMVEGVTEEHITAMNDTFTEVAKETERRPKSILLEE